MFRSNTGFLLATSNVWSTHAKDVGMVMKPQNGNGCKPTSAALVAETVMHSFPIEMAVVGCSLTVVGMERIGEQLGEKDPTKVAEAYARGMLRPHEQERLHFETFAEWKKSCDEYLYKEPQIPGC
jgi:hypothetical protein